MALEKFGMSYRNLGSSGLRVSRLAIAISSCRTQTNLTGGYNLISEESLEQVLHLAYEAGVNYFDVSDSPSVSNGKAELVFGKIIKRKKWRRSSFIVATKVQRNGNAETERGLSRKSIIESCQLSLERLGLPYVDIVLAPKRERDSAPIEEIVRAFTWLIEKGLCFYWGTAGWSQSESLEAYTVAKLIGGIHPLVLQHPYNFFERDNVELAIPELICNIGCGSITSSPMAGGLIGDQWENGDGDHQLTPHSGRVSFLLQDHERDRGQPDTHTVLHKVKCLKPVASQLGVTLPQLAVAWCLRNDLVQTVLVAPTSLEEMRDTLGAVSTAENKLTPESLAIMEKILGNQPTMNGNQKQLKGGPKGAQHRRRSSIHRKSISSSPRLSITHVNNPYESRGGYRDSIDHGADRRFSHM